MAHLLVLIRHAKSDWSGDHADLDRPLAPRGRRQAPEAGRWLAAHLPELDLALVSPAARARDTWDLVAAALPHPPVSEVDQRLYFGGGLLAVVRDLPESADRVALVAHNPSLESLLERLTGRWATLKTSAIAVVELPGAWASAGDEPASLVASGRPPIGGPTPA